MALDVTGKGACERVLFKSAMTAARESDPVSGGVAELDSETGGARIGDSSFGIPWRTLWSNNKLPLAGALLFSSRLGVEDDS